MAARLSKGPLRRAGTLSRNVLRGRVATQHAWCVVDKETGKVLTMSMSRRGARSWATRNARSKPTTVVLVDLRVRGERA